MNRKTAGRYAATVHDSGGRIVGKKRVNVYFYIHVVVDKGAVIAYAIKFIKSITPFGEAVRKINGENVILLLLLGKV